MFFSFGENGVSTCLNGAQRDKYNATAHYTPKKREVKKIPFFVFGQRRKGTAPARHEIFCRQRQLTPHPSPLAANHSPFAPCYPVALSANILNSLT